MYCCVQYISLYSVRVQSLMHCTVMWGDCCAAVRVLQLRAEERAPGVPDAAGGGAVRHVRARLVPRALQVHRRRQARPPHVGLGARSQEGLGLSAEHWPLTTDWVTTAEHTTGSCECESTRIVLVLNSYAPATHITAQLSLTLNLELSRCSALYCMNELSRVAFSPAQQLLPDRSSRPVAFRLTPLRSLCLITYARRPAHRSDSDQHQYQNAFQFDSLAYSLVQYTHRLSDTCRYFNLLFWLCLRLLAQPTHLALYSHCIYVQYYCATQYYWVLNRMLST